LDHTPTITSATNADSPSADNRIETYDYAVNGAVVASTQNSFDSFKRVEEKVYTVGNKEYAQKMYFDRSRVTSVRDTVANTTKMNYYYYDDCNRIVRVDMGGMTTAYHYDVYGQLVREDNQSLDMTMVYEYNNIGNLISAKKYSYTASTSSPSGTPVTTSFGYSNDKLTTFGNASIAYNSIGCPTTYEGKSLTWTKGKLSRMFSGTLATGTSSYNYTYNAFGQRVSRTYSYLPSNSSAVQIGQLTEYNKSYYYDHAGRLISENVSKAYYSAGSTSESIVFLYDESGIIGMARTVGSTTNAYYFQRNLLGDVVAIYDTSGNMVAKYLYDAWGNCTISSETTNTVVANANPIRYRGYYYDDDTGLYYLNARYYSPKWRRFISPDDTAYLDPESVNGLNLYCYCNNDPVNYCDPSGHAIESPLDLISLGVGVVDVLTNPHDPLAWLGLVGDIVDLIPCVTGVGDSVRMVKLSVSMADDTHDVVRTMRKVYSSIPDTGDVSFLLKATGSYEIVYESGYRYIGKGGIYRSTVSALQHLAENDTVREIIWRSAPNTMFAFVHEYWLQIIYKFKEGGKLFNEIWSPGRNIVAKLIK